MQQLKTMLALRFTRNSEEIMDLTGLNFQLSLRVQLQKNNPDGTEKCTGSVLCHKQEAILQTHEAGGALDKASPHIQELLER